MLRDLLYGALAALHRHRERRAATTATLALARQLRDLLCDPRSTPQAQTRLLNEIAVAEDRRERAT